MRTNLLIPSLIHVQNCLYFCRSHDACIIENTVRILGKLIIGGHHSRGVIVKVELFVKFQLISKFINRLDLNQTRAHFHPEHTGVPAAFVVVFIDNLLKIKDKKFVFCCERCVSIHGPILPCPGIMEYRTWRERMSIKAKNT